MHRRMIKLSLAVALLAASALLPHTATACEAPLDLRAIDAALARAQLPPDALARARQLRIKGAALIESGKRDEGRSAYRQLTQVLGMPASSGTFRC
ncbi:hypothetical protein SAMN05443249_2779 [Beijerinckia sp. 28-YEA-48]|nr:hypothetical protein SAMN05443249_2779 [Beijerinckia sp. 28-YEA-48]